MTDLDHLVELLHRSTPTGRSNVAGLLATLDNSVSGGDLDTEVDGDVTAAACRVRSQSGPGHDRVDGQGARVPHCLPSRAVASDRYEQSGDLRRSEHRAEGIRRRQRQDVARCQTGGAQKEMASAATAGEQLRLLYVALTRAQHHTILWWANGQGSARTALARVLFASRVAADGGGVPLDAAVPIPADDSTAASLAPLIGASAGSISLATIDDGPWPVGRWADPDDSVGHEDLEAAQMTVVLDRAARRWSFTAITDGGAVAASDPYDLSLGDSGAADEGSDQADDVDEDEADRSPGDPLWPPTSLDPARAGPLARLPAGSAFGTLSMRCSNASTSAPREMGSVPLSMGSWPSYPVDLTPFDQPDGPAEDGRRLLIDGLGMALRTPLGPLCRGRSLADIGTADRLNEMSFDLRLGEGGRRATVADLGRVMLAHLDPSDPLRAWADGVASGVIDVELAGHLTGSIDLILRIAGEGGPRFVVVDYKTNVLTPRGSVPVPEDYRPSRMVEAMVEHDYPLQALLYSVALHRYLRWRLPDYRPAEHLGGAAYLFVRGMTGPDVIISGGRPHGVFEWNVPPALVVGLSDLLDGQAVAEPVS